MVERYKYKCIDAYEEPENPMEWLPCPRCGLRPLVWEFDNGRVTAWGCCLLSSCAAVKSPVTGYVYQETQSPYNI